MCGLTGEIFGKREVSVAIRYEHPVLRRINLSINQWVYFSWQHSCRISTMIQIELGISMANTVQNTGHKSKLAQIRQS